MPLEQNKTYLKDLGSVSRRLEAIEPFSQKFGSDERMAERISQMEAECALYMEYLTKLAQKPVRTFYP
jgi:hypothetical protein